MEPVYTAKPIVITDVSIIDVGSGTTIPHRSVLIRDQRIIAVDALDKLSIPEDALRINGTNRFLIPSLWDMLAHIYKVRPLLDMPLYIAYGVTNVREMTSCANPNDPFVACPDDLKSWLMLPNKSICGTSYERFGPNFTNDGRPCSSAASRRPSSVKH